MPTEFTSAVSGPAALANSIAASTAASSATSRISARPPISAATFAAASASMSAHTTSAASAWAAARPMLLPAPVTNATSPSRRYRLSGSGRGMDAPESNSLSISPPGILVEPRQAAVAGGHLVGDVAGAAAGVGGRMHRGRAHVEALDRGAEAGELRDRTEAGDHAADLPAAVDHVGRITPPRLEPALEELDLQLAPVAGRERVHRRRVVLDQNVVLALGRARRIPDRVGAGEHVLLLLDRAELRSLFMRASTTATGCFADDVMGLKGLLHCLPLELSYEPPAVAVAASPLLTDALVAAGVERSVEYFPRAAVDEILVSGAKAIGVKLKNGETIRADLVVSNLGLPQTILRLMREVAIDAKMARRLNNIHCDRSQVFWINVALNDIRAPLFVVSTETDHVAPWRSVHKLHALNDAELTFVLTSGGHNAGVVSPPGHPRRHYRILRRDAGGHYLGPDEWFAVAQPHDGSWWPAWADWLDAHSAGRVPPPATGSDRHPAIEPAPGKYVLQK